jgi:Fe-S-cluster-containing hydrogenase component 2
LAYLFTPEEADLAAKLHSTPETAEEFAARIGGEFEIVINLLNNLADKELVNAETVDGERVFSLMPFMIGFYENQESTIDVELARLYEDYIQKSSKRLLEITPQFHRVIPVNETIKVDMEVHPHESITDILASAKAWSVFDCICRKQKALIGDPCEHPVELCMAFSETPGAFDGDSHYKAVTQEEAFKTLQHAADVGLVHTVSNRQEDIGYLCNCCTCSCSMLRGMSETGIANSLVRSAFVNTVDAAICSGCENCLDYCQFNALTMEDQIAIVSAIKCIGCGVCVPSCETEAIALTRRPEDEIIQVPVTEEDWGVERAKARGIDLDIVR